MLRRSNKYIDETMPWVLGKDPEKRSRIATVLYNLLEAIRFSAVLLQPFLPETAEKMFKQLNSTKTGWETLAHFNGTEIGSKVGSPEILFARIDTEKKFDEIKGDKLAETEEKKEDCSKEEKPVKSEITIDDFAKMDLKVAEIIGAEKHPKADRLLVLQLKVGDETRQVVSGIAQHYTPEGLIGQKVIVIANLKPVKLRGVESQGMILAASTDEKLVLVGPNGEIESGTNVS